METIKDRLKFFCNHANDVTFNWSVSIYLDSGLSALVGILLNRITPLKQNRVGCYQRPFFCVEAIEGLAE